MFDETLQSKSGVETIEKVNVKKRVVFTFLFSNIIESYTLKDICLYNSYRMLDDCLYKIDCL